MSEILKSESAVIGSMILDPGCVDIVRHYVRDPKYIRNAVYRETFQQIVSMHDSGQNIDLVTIGDKLKSTESVVVVAEAVNNTITSAHAEEYARIIRDSHVRRLMSEKLKGINPLDTKKYPMVLDVINSLEKTAIDAGRIIEEIHEQAIEDLVGEVYDEYYMEDEETTPGAIIPTGLYDLDKIIGGLELGENVIIAARPGMGKTSLALSVAVNIAKKGRKVIFFSLEMKKKRLIRRLLCMEARIDSVSFREKELSQDDHDRLAVAANTISGLPLVIIDNINTTVEMRSIVARHTIRGNVGAVFIDYLQLVSDPAARGRSRSNEVGESAKSIQRIANNYGVPTVTLSQLNRECEKRDDKRPKVPDLYESGDIEAAADKIAFIYRDEEYYPETEDRGVAEIAVAKQRDGEKGMCRLAWIGYCMRFDNLARGG